MFLGQVVDEIRGERTGAGVVARRRGKKSVFFTSVFYKRCIKQLTPAVSKRRNKTEMRNFPFPTLARTVTKKITQPSPRGLTSSSDNVVGLFSSESTTLSSFLVPEG